MTSEDFPVKMNDRDVARQIHQMVRFIRQEAEEKTNEISVSTEEEFNTEKLQLVETEKKEKQNDVRKTIMKVPEILRSLFGQVTV